MRAVCARWPSSFLRVMLSRAVYGIARIMRKLIASRGYMPGSRRACVRLLRFCNGGWPAFHYGKICYRHIGIEIWAMLMFVISPERRLAYCSVICCRSHRSCISRYGRHMHFRPVAALNLHCSTPGALPNLHQMNALYIRIKRPRDSKAVARTDR